MPHPDFILPYMSLEQISEVMAYDQLEPIGGYREDYRFAQVCLMLHNLIQMQRGDSKFVRADIYDFMPWGPDVGRHKAADQPQTVEDMKAVLLGIAKSSKKAEKL